MDVNFPAPVRRRGHWLEPRHVLFFALRLDPGTRALVVRQWTDLCAGLGLRADPVPAHWLHLSLLGVFGDDAPPPGRILDLLRAAAAKVPSVPFEIELDRVQSFSRKEGSKPLVLTETRRTEALTVLHDRLRSAVKEAGFDPPDGFGTPHVTMAYGRALPEAMPIRPIPMVVSEFCLIHSQQGRSWQEVLGRWPLRGWN